LRETLVGNFAAANFVFYSAWQTSEPIPANVDDTQAAVAEAKLLWRPAELPAMEVDRLIAALSSARGMISHDDGDSAIHSVQMPPDSPVFVLLRSKRRRSVRRLGSWRKLADNHYDSQ
jgi:hypothetical protein